MGSMRVKAILAAVTLGGVAAGLTTLAAAGDGGSFSERLSGYEEVPAVSSAASGHFRATLDSDEVEFSLSYRDLQGDVLQAHIHFGQRAVNGGISVFLCSNLASAPAGTPACPAAPARISGTFTAANVIGPAGQGIAAGEFDELVKAMRNGITYANVHSSVFPDGEIRAQLERGDEDDD
jgi:hypothetical protein